MIDADGDLKVLDFGLAATLAESVSQVSRQSTGSGTPAYMSPQQLRGEDPELGDDLYALGATLYELLAGQPPFRSTQPSVLMHQVLNETPQTINHRRAKAGQPPVPPEWEQTIMDLLAKDPKARPQSAGEVAERLGLTTKDTKGTKQRTEDRKVERLDPKTLSSGPVEPGLRTGSERVGTPRSTSKTPLYAGLAAAALLLGGLGWWFGIHAPEQKRLAAARGGIVVRTNPSGAEVRVGAIALEKSPLTLKDQRLGKYPVRVRLDGYEEWTGEVEVKENEFADLDVSLVRSTGTAAFSSDPPGLEVEVVGRAVPGTPAPAPRQTVRTPADLKLPTGAYELTFRRPGWPEQKRTVEIARNQTVAATAEFVPGSLLVESTPAGADVWIAGQVAGRTPLRLPEALPGAGEVELKLKGHKSATLRGTIEPRRELRLSAVLEKIPGPETGQAFTIPDLNLTLQPIAAGTFQMGSASGGYSDERPVTRVTLTKPFWLGKTEVTQAQWAAVMGSNPSHFKGDNLPVEQVSWTDAMEFCRKLTERERAAGRLPEGHAYTLPTEAQWEYACRAGTTGDYAGNLDAMGWYTGNSGNTTKPVGTKQANAWGLHDMHGNVWEWCADWYGSYPGGGVTDPTGATSGSSRVFRGGSWWNVAVLCRSARRYGGVPDGRGNVLGFRLALSSVQ